jgi:predicted Zn-dependent peptidase
MRVRGAILGCAVAAAACGPANDPSHQVTIPLAASTTKYANGFELITDEDHGAPVVAVNLSYRVGSRDDPPGRAGMAHLVEHLMFRGSRHVQMGEFEQRVHGAGGTYDARTSLDRTDYFERIASREIELALWLESDRLLSNLETIDDATLAVERDVVKNEWRQRSDDVKSGGIYDVTQGAIFPEGHPYHHLPIGTPADLDRITLEEAKAFARRHYVPSNATLALVGDFDRDTEITSVNHWFGSLPKTSAPVRVDPASVPIPALKGVTRLEIEADIDYPQVLVSWPGPRLFREDDAEVDEYFSFLAGVLGGWLVSTDHVARSVTGFRFKGDFGSHDAIIIALAQGTPYEAAIDAVDKLLEESRETRMRPRSVDDERVAFTTSVIDSLEPFGSRAREYNLFRDTVGRALFAPTLIERYDGVRAYGMRDLKPRWFPDDARVITIVHPVKGAPIAGRLVSAR